MSHLNWTEQLEGWQAGRYQIELVAPGLWVLSRRTEESGFLRNKSPDRILATAGSLSSLKYRADQLARQRARTFRLVRRLVLFVVSVLAVAVAANSTAGWAPLASIGGACVGLISLLAVIDSFAERSFEHLSATYQ